MIKKTQSPASVLFVLILAFLLFLGMFFIYNKLTDKMGDVAKMKTEQTFTADELILSIQDNNLSKKDVVEKVIEIEGEIKEITYKNDMYSLVLKEETNTTTILCAMQADQTSKILKLKVGQKVKLKGVLKGFLMDVIVLHCVIV